MVLTFLTYMLVCCAEPFSLWKSTRPRQKDKNPPCESKPIQGKKTKILLVKINPQNSKSKSNLDFFSKSFPTGGRWHLSTMKPYVCIFTFSKVVVVFFTTALLWKKRREGRDFILLELLICPFHIQYLGNIIAFLDPLWLHYKVLWTPAYLMP